jgi:cation diffusion facilitator family transporter
MDAETRADRAAHQDGHAGQHDHASDHDNDHHDDHDHGGGHAHGHDHTLLSPLRHAITPHSHDPSAATDSALESSAEGTRAVKVGLLVLGVTALLQAVVVVLSGSVALLADTVHNLSDALTAVPLWIAFALARRTPTRRFTYGLGRVEDLAGLFVVLMIAASALLAGWESVRRLSQPTPVEHVAAVAAAGVIGFLGNEAVAMYRMRIGTRIGSAALLADGKHARADGITSLGVVLGALGVALGYRLADPILGLAITAAILVILVGVVRDVGRRLLDGVDPAIVTRGEDVLRSVPGVLDVPEIRIRWIGHRMRADAVLAVDGALGVREGHDVATAATRAMREALPQLDAVSVHIEPLGVAPH